MRVFSEALIASNIAAARRARGLSQNTLAAMLDTTQPTLAIYENARRSFTYPRAVAYTVACGVKLSQLLGLEPLDADPYVAPYAVETHRGRYIYSPALFRLLSPKQKAVVADTPEEAARLRLQDATEHLASMERQSQGDDFYGRFVPMADVSRIPILSEKTMAKNLRDVRKLMGMMAMDVSAAVGVGQAAQSHREIHTVRSVSVLELMRYAKTFGITVESVVGIEHMVPYDWSDIQLNG